MFTAFATPIIAVGAHFDDIELGCGGTLAQIAKHNPGAARTIVATHSAFTSVNARTRSAELAKKEGWASAHCLGLPEPICLGWETGNVCWNADSVSTLERVLREFRPRTILIHHLHDTHQDHHALSRIAYAAARRFENILMYEPMPPSGRTSPPFHPQVYCDITAFMPKKLEALRMHQSQVEHYGETWLKAVEARAVYRGYEAGVGAAEAFEVLRIVLA